MNHILRKGQWLDGFRVQEYCKTYGLNNAESYKVVDENGNEAIMKIIIDGCGCVEFTETVCDLMERVSMTRKSVSESDRQTYDAMKQLMESSPKPQERRRIGFVTANN